MNGPAHSTQPPSNGSLLLLLQVLHERQSSMDRRLQTIETTLMQGSWSREEPDTPTATGQDIWSRIREALTLANLAVRAGQMIWRAGWVGMFYEGFRLLFRLFVGH